MKTVPGTNLVRISQVGQLLSLEIRPLSDAPTSPGNWTLPIAALPQLLTGGNVDNATGLTVNSYGQVELIGSNLPVVNGDVVAKNVTAQTATLSSTNNLTLPESQLLTTGDLNLLAQNTVLIRDSRENSFNAQAGGNINVIGNQGVDILAINHAQATLNSGGNLSLATNNNNGVSADGFFISGGNFLILNLASANPGNFFSIFDPIINSGGNVSFADYRGASLKIVANGNVTLGNVEITRPSVQSAVPTDAPDFTALTTKRSLIINAATGTITTGNINTSSTDAPDAGPVTLKAQGNILTGNIRTNDPINGDSGSVNLLSTQGNIFTGGIFTNDQGNSNSGFVNLTAAGNITFDRIDTTKRGNGNAGPVTLIAPGNISNLRQIDSRNFGFGADGEVKINPTPPPVPPTPPPVSPTPPPVPPTPPPVPPTPPPVSPTPPPVSPTPPPVPPTPPPVSPTPPPVSPTPPPTPSPNSNNQKPIDSQTQTPVTSQGEVGSIINKTSQESDPVYRLEETFTKEFENYFQRPAPAKIHTSEDVRSRLRQLEQATKVKTGVIYVRFKPLESKPETACPTVSETVSVSRQQDRRIGALRSDVSDANQQQNCTTAPNNQLEILLISAEGEPIRQEIKGVNRTKVLAVTQEFQRALTNPKNVNTTSYLNSAQQLYQWMIAPIETQLKARNIKSLIFAMDSGLRSLPVAALHDGKGFLVEKYSVNLVPSISLTSSRYQDVRSLQVLAMGASEFQNQAPLPGVKVELATITEQLWQGKSFLNDSFTMSNLQAQRRATPYGIVHLATHAEFRAGAAKNSYIQFWDRKLRLNELDQLHLSNPPVELLVLSACRTALGNEQAELGFAGSAFQAGVSSTLATLWYVNDRGALGLTTEFYHQLSQVPLKSQALQQAQLAMIQGRVRIENNLLYSSGKSIALPPRLASLAKLNLSHPYYWAAFTLVGQP